MKRAIPICVIGGWATYFHVNQNFKRAFGQDYMKSRDIDLFFNPDKEKEFSEVVFKQGFEKNGMPFRYEKIYQRELKKFMSIEESKKELSFNLMQIFLDLFSNRKTTELGSWVLQPLGKISFETIEGYPVADINTLVELKAVALFERDKADKENKDACDFYSLFQYSGKRINSSIYIKKAVEKLIKRSDLIDAIARHVLLDIGKRSIVIVTLQQNLQQLETTGYYQTP
ncbi:hypothetical protein HYV85_04570 [Candidatus Woesearchaeota archaeon]|nr:hypothetical protein [Candidatus Woesearchaeota archaeon]